MKKILFKIDGMDCADEIAILKGAVGKLVPVEDRLSFDLIKGVMTVLVSDDTYNPALIIEAVRKTGMRAVELLPGRSAAAGRLSFWERKGKTVTPVLSALFLLSGILTHAFYENSIAVALTSGREGEHGFPLVTIMFYTCAILAGGWFVAPRAFFSARRMKPDMNLLMCVAVVGAVIIDEWFEAAAVAFLFSLALWLETWSVEKARHAIKALIDISPATARYISSASKDIKEEPVENIAVGVTVIVRPGEMVPLDGIVTKGLPAVNQAPITGESIPVGKNTGDEVFAGTINGDSAFEFRTTKPASDTTLSRIIHMVEEAQSRRAKSEQWVEKFASWYTPLMMLMAFLLGTVPPLFFGGEWDKWFYEALVLLVIACPCALVISTPVSIVCALAAAARSGVLIKGGSFLEIPQMLKVIAMDKTGTITTGKPAVNNIIPFNGHSEEELLAIAAGLEKHSTHPLAHAVINKANETGIAYDAAEEFSIIQGKGATGKVFGKRHWIGSHRMIEELGLESEEFHKIATKMADAGNSLVGICNETHICGLIVVSDQIRKDIKKTIQELRDAGISRIVVLTGDNRQSAEAVAACVNADECRAELLPEDKLREIAALKEKFGEVAMVGDGVNDAPAMAEATLGVAMGAIGSDVAIETADITLMSDDLSRLPWLIRHSRNTLRVIKQNIFFALGLKFLFILMAVSGTATLWMAIAADMGASLLVIFNGLRLLEERQILRGNRSTCLNSA